MIFREFNENNRHNIEKLYDFINEQIQKFYDKKIDQTIKSVKDIPETEKEELIKRFFTIYKTKPSCYQNYPTSDIQIDINVLLNRIKGNYKLKHIIAGAQREYEKNIDNFLGFDCTNFVIAPIKAIERYLKEVLIQKYPNNINFIQGGRICPIYFKNNINITAEDLSSDSGKSKLDNQRYIDGNINNVHNKLTLGETSISIQHALMNNSNYNGIFKKRVKQVNGQNKPYFYFNEYFIQKVRNGYLHIDIVDSIEKAKDIYFKTSYWFAKSIEEFDIELI